jgi:hypothetical protein
MQSLPTLAPLEVHPSSSPSSPPSVVGESSNSSKSKPIARKTSRLFNRKQRSPDTPASRRPSASDTLSSPPDPELADPPVIIEPPSNARPRSRTKTPTAVDILSSSNSSTRGFSEFPSRLSGWLSHTFSGSSTDLSLPNLLSQSNLSASQVLAGSPKTKQPNRAPHGCKAQQGPPRQGNAVYTRQRRPARQVRRTNLAHGCTAPRPRTSSITNHSHIPTNLYSYFQARPQARLGIYLFPLLISPSKPEPYHTFQCLKSIHQLERRQLSSFRCELKTRQLLAALFLRRFHILHLVHLPKLLFSHPRHLAPTTRTYHTCRRRRRHLSRPSQKSSPRPARQNGGRSPKRDGRATRGGGVCFALVNRSWPTRSCTSIWGVTGANLSTRRLPLSTRLTSESSPGSSTRPRRSARSASTAWRLLARNWARRSAAGLGPPPPRARSDGWRTSSRRRALL